VAIEDFAPSLVDEQVPRIKLDEDVVEECCACVELATGLFVAWIALQNEPGNAGDFAKLRASEFADVGAFDGVFQETFGSEEFV
jgi:hypothetical protein